MASVDDIFRQSRTNLAPKRKLDDPTATSSYRSQAHKSAKLTNGASPRSARSNGHSSARTGPPLPAAVEDETPVEDDDDDIEAGPSLPPGDAEEDGPEEDEEGRFFGGGVTKQERQALDYLENNDDPDNAEQAEEVYDLAWLRRTAVSLQKKIDKNADMRARYSDQPQKFIQSEADLDDELKGLSILSEHAELYSEFAKTTEGGLESVVNLLAHENTDIAIRAVHLLVELTDEDTGAEESQWKSLVQAALKFGVVELLVSNLERLDETVDDSDRDGVYRVLELLENISSDATNILQIGTQRGLLSWLKTRIKQSDSSSLTKVGQNRQYAAEILAILLQGNARIREQFIANLDGVDTLLQLLSAYRKRDPERDSEEEELAENLFDGLTVLVDDDEGATAFLEGEGMELCLIMLREGKFSKVRALKVLDHTLSGRGAARSCERLVEAAGLRTVFGIFMKTRSKGQPNQQQHTAEERETQEHLLGIFAALLRHTAAESPARIRTLAKFVERDYEKITRLVELRKEYSRRLAKVDAEIEEEKQVIDAEDQVEMEAEWFSRRLDAGLFVGQTVDVILAWLIAEDAGSAVKARASLGELEGVSKSLNEQIDGIDRDAGEDGKAAREMLETLLRCVDAAAM